MKKKLKIMIVVGEASGDAHAAKLVSALRKLAPETDFEFFGATSVNLRASGVETIVKADELSIVGMPEIARALPMFWKTFQILKKSADQRKPDAVVLVDFPDFNLKLAKSLKKKGFNVIYYISPQLWAWRQYRARTIEKYVDLLLTILPFEKDWYQKRKINHVRYVGNPLAGEVKSALSKKEFCEKYKLDENKPIISLLPGSRRKEVSLILPVMFEAAGAMLEKRSDLQFVVAIPLTRKIGEVEEILAQARTGGASLSEKILIVQNETKEALAASDAAAVASGTATLETAIIGTPLAIVYKTSNFNYKLLRPLISVEHFGLVNLIAGKKVAKELIQNELTKENLSAELFNLLEPENNRKMRVELKKTVEKLGDGGASRKAAQIILDFLQSRLASL